jgi:hypothetical protein
MMKQPLISRPYLAGYVHTRSSDQTEQGAKPGNKNVNQDRA